ncbi:hypothetical protein BN6_21710 [Saccharothrix espanaensis DSM 44229]|uniref:Uncharacterized protein n=1 Tax=Saccharothrix espanaensis (strain ATCC 51144 / DSM 44229 / JCM 9112 / NBRC 15066 / NRRL 15764) TaxID=1179773 RepID=K0JZ10_SACES|nr:hypothetical protein BN6_21710 [Saccharothrix espanaensis DSM 44229]
MTSSAGDRHWRWSSITGSAAEPLVEQPQTRAVAWSSEEGRAGEDQQADGGEGGQEQEDAGHSAAAVGR